MPLREDLAALGRGIIKSAVEAASDWLKADPPLKEPERSPEVSMGVQAQSPMPMGMAPMGFSDPNIDHPVPQQSAENDPKSLFYDPFAIIEQLGYKDKPSQISYGTLRNIVWKVPIIQSIIQTRINQISAFSYPQSNRYQMGYRIRLRDHDAKPTPADKKWSAKCEEYLQNTGVTCNPAGRDNFETFIRKLAWDTLTYDQVAIEVVPNRLGQPAEWYAVDGASVRIADTATTFMNEDQVDAIRYVQIYDGMIVAEYKQNEMVFGVRNPRSDIRQHGYGTSELEMMIPVVTSLLWSWAYNAKFFSQGSAAKGILNFKGAVPEKQLSAFRRHWYQMLSGVENAWRTPITNAEDLQWVNMQANNRDMEFSAWMDFLIKVACSLFLIDPIEVNFQYGNIGQSSALQESSNTDKITESRERGLRPLLRHLSSWINRGIIWPLNEDFEFEFVGLDAKTRDEVMAYTAQAVRSVRTIDELRAEDDLPPLPDGSGAIILDPTWNQVRQQAQQQQQQQQQAFAGPQQPQQPGMPPELAAMMQQAPGGPEQQQIGGPPEESPNTDVPFEQVVQKSRKPATEKKVVVDITL